MTSNFFSKFVDSLMCQSVSLSWKIALHNAGCVYGASLKQKESSRSFHRCDRKVVSTCSLYSLDFETFLTFNHSLIGYLNLFYMYICW